MKQLAFLLTVCILMTACNSESDDNPDVADAPRSLQISPLSDKAVKLSWKNPKQKFPRDFIVQRIVKGTTFASGTTWGSSSLNIGNAVECTCSGNDLIACDSTIYTFTDTTTTANTTYVYRVYSRGYYQGSTPQGMIGGYSEMEATTPAPTVNLSNVSIGNQTWAGKNLDVTTYRNGETIPQVKSLTQWNETKTGAWCYFNFDSTYAASYGKIYNKYAVNDPRGLAPSGWRIPTSSDWYTLRDFLGGKQVAGDKLKATTLWKGSPGKATNSSGFTAFPSGYVDPKNANVTNTYYAYYWTTTDTSFSQGIQGRMTFWLHYEMSELYNSVDTANFGYAIRCIKN